MACNGCCPVFEPVYDQLVEHSQQQTLWHADETRWLVFATWEGKVGYRWYLWVFHAAEVVVFVLSPGRSHEVPEEHLGPVEEGILVVDRYTAYQAMDQVKDGTIVLAFCWAHVRRDFLDVARSWPDQEAWALGWVERIGELYDVQRPAAGGTPTTPRSPRATRRCAGVWRRWNSSGSKNWPGRIAPGAAQVLESLRNHWSGPDGVRGASRGADGQQHGGAVGAWAGGGAEELLRLGSGLERPVGRDALLAVPDAGVVGDSIRGSG